jgi:hypothetical protein
VKADEKKISVSLKPSLTSTRDPAYLESYFHEQALLSATQWGAEFAIGSVVSAEVLALESFGVLAAVRSTDGSVTVNALAIPAQYQLKPKVGVMSFCCLPLMTVSALRSARLSKRSLSTRTL